MFKPRPSFFDVCVAGLLYMPWIKGNWERSVFFILYTIFIILFSIFLKPKREYRSLPLMLLAMWSFLGLFVHSFIMSPDTTSSFHSNYILLIDGFLYILCAILFIITVVKYSTNTRFIFLLLPLGMYPWYNDFVRVGSLTPVAAFGVAIVAYLFLSKRAKWGIVALLWGITATVYNWWWVVYKFKCRPFVWGQLLKNTFWHPVMREGANIVDPGIEFSPFLEQLFITYIPNFANVKPWLASVFGAGFSQWSNVNYVWVTKDNYGWLYRHSDYGALANDLGPIALIFILWWIVESFRKIGIQPALILAITVALVCSFQVTMYLPFKAGIYLMMITLAITEGEKRRQEI